MGWQSIANYTQRSLGRIDQATADKAASREEGISSILQGVSLLDKWSSGQKELSALKSYGEEQGLTYNKKTKSFGGTLEDQNYSISTGDLKNIRDLTAYGDQTFQSMLTGKGGMVRPAYAINRPERPKVPVATEDEFFDEEIIVEDTKMDEFGDWEEPYTIPKGIDEPSQESESGGVDPHPPSAPTPKGESLWSKFKTHVGKGLKETGGEFSFSNFGDIADWFKKGPQENEAYDKKEPIPFEEKIQTSDWAPAAFDYGLFNTQEDKSLIGQSGVKLTHQGVFDTPDNIEDYGSVSKYMTRNSPK